MLVSAAAGADLRRAVADKSRPAPEYLRLQQRHGVDLLDWTELGVEDGHRSIVRSLRQCRTALSRAGGYDVIFSDGEHLGIPLGLALRTTTRTPHLTIGHNLLTPAKVRLLRHLPASGIDRIVVHSPEQVSEIARRTAIPRSKLIVVPYGVDTSFWSAADEAEDNLVVSAGREHRDYRTLVEALPTGVRAIIADHSPHTPHATRRDPLDWPPSVTRVAVDPQGLRALYARATVVVVPVVETLMPAGITTLLEAMSMGQAIVATETTGLRGILTHGQNAMLVAPGETGAMRNTIAELLKSSETRQELGIRARRTAVERFDVDVFADALAGHLRAIGESQP
jgi:glycosyltransferase involved in cell wall biosynthesis